MSEADRVPSPAAPAAGAVAAAPEEKKGKEPERQKLPPSGSAGVGATAVGAGREPRGAPTAGIGREGRGPPGARVFSGDPRATQGEAPSPPSWGRKERVVPLGQPRPLRQLHLPPSGNEVAASAGCFW